MASEKIIERVEKLIRLASPGSGTTDAERASAALEAVRLMQEHGIAIQSVKNEPKNDAKSKKTVAHGVWVLTQALQHCSCSACAKLISPGDVVWFRSTANLTREYRHNAGTCRVA